MLRGFAIKKNVYQGSDGVQVDAVRDVKTFDTKQEAEAAAANCGGHVINVHKREPKPRKPSRRNQAWMNELK
ncbi:hypothetical protein [Enterococcus olivae]